MKRLNRLKSNKINNLNLGQDMNTLPVLTATGTKQILIESSYTLLQYKENDITLECNEIIVQIIGSNLIISFMYPDELMLVGEVDQIIYHQQ